MRAKARDRVKEHYVQQAAKWKDSKLSTMEDGNIRDKEVETIVGCLSGLHSHFNQELKVLELGCGNGYTADQLVKTVKMQLTCIDDCQELLAIARRRNLPGVQFQAADVLKLEFSDASFDVIFSERCLINLDTWVKQRQALTEAARVLKPGGVFLVMEAFTDGLEKLNEARNAVGLGRISQPFHNRFFDKRSFLEFMKSQFRPFSLPGVHAIENGGYFLSSYYFGSRVLYPALIAGRKDLVYNNAFVEFFKYVPAVGTYGAVQALLFEKRSNERRPVLRRSS